MYYEDYELKNDLANYTLNNIKIQSAARLEILVLWSPEVPHLLGHNLNLSKAIIGSIKKKKYDNNKLLQINVVFKQQKTR